MVSVSDDLVSSSEHPPHPVDLLLSFDTTGSMSACIEEVQKCALELVERLFKDVCDLRIAVIAHGDYCDHKVPACYVIKWVDFTNDVSELCRFIQTAGGTTGGDWEECYELVLRRAHSQLTWRESSERIMVVMGDAIPHPADDPQNEDHINWRVEAYHLADKMGVEIHSVQFLSGQAYYDERATEFWESLASLGQGCHLVLKNFPPVVDVILGIVYRKKGYSFLQAFEAEIRQREGILGQELQDIFSALGIKNKPVLDPNQNQATFPTKVFYSTSGTGADSGPVCDNSVLIDEQISLLIDDINASIKSSTNQSTEKLGLKSCSLEKNTQVPTNGNSVEILSDPSMSISSLKRMDTVTTKSGNKRFKPAKSCEKLKTTETLCHVSSGNKGKRKIPSKKQNVSSKATVSQKQVVLGRSSVSGRARKVIDYKLFAAQGKSILTKSVDSKMSETPSIIKNIKDKKIGASDKQLSRTVNRTMQGRGPNASSLKPGRPGVGRPKLLTQSVTKASLPLSKQNKTKQVKGMKLAEKKRTPTTVAPVKKRGRPRKEFSMKQKTSKVDTKSTKSTVGGKLLHRKNTSRKNKGNS